MYDDSKPNRAPSIFSSTWWGTSGPGLFRSVGIMFAAAMVTAASAAGAAARPNVLIIMPDDISYDDFSRYNPAGPRTPHLDALAAESVRLTDFHVSPTCSPTRAALMTGRYNDATGVWHTILGRYFLRPGEVTMADVFKANGYRTALFGKWHLGDNYPFRPQDRGFEHVAMIRGGGIDQQHNVWGNTNNPPSTLWVDNQPVPLAAEDDGMGGAFSTNFFTNRAIDYIKMRAERHEPFFAYLAYNVVHPPHDLPPGARAGLDAHDATMENLDRNISRLLRFLEVARLADDTMVVFLCDNGMANHLLRGGKASQYEGGHRVPCFIRWKAGGLGGRGTAGRDMERLVGHIDLLPTLMDLLSLRDVAYRPTGVPLNGRSFKTLLDADPANDEPALARRVLTTDNQRMDALVKYKQASVMQDTVATNGRLEHKWRLIRESAAARWALYDITSDPKQQRDRSNEPANAAVVTELAAAYEAWWRDISARADEYIRPPIGSPAQPTTCLYSHDWHVEAIPPWNHGMVAAGLKSNGFHAVEFVRAGRYAFDLRRWPREIAGETTITSALAHAIPHGPRDQLTTGVALPVATARLRIWNGATVLADERQPVEPTSDGPVFTLPLPAGPAMIQTWFYDPAGHELAGAYYVYVDPAK
jgi:arylsulfatase A-like enzyme